MTPTVFSARRMVSVLATALPLFVVACAAPQPDEASDDGESAISSTPNGKISAVGASVEPRTNAVGEGANIVGPYASGHVDVCHVFEDGTDAQKHACDVYPTNYHPMSCVGAIDTANQPARLYSRCASGNGYPDPAYRPYDQGNGRYTVHFVNHFDPTDRKTASVYYTSFIFHVTVSGRELGQTSPFLLNAQFILDPGSTTKLTQGLHLTVGIDPKYVDEVMGCATGYSTVGMSADEIAKKDAEQLELCKNPDAKIKGRDGWMDTPPGNYAGVEDFLTYDATPLLQPNLHVIFAFQVRGVLQTYIFTT